MAQHTRRRVERFTPRHGVLDPAGFPHGMLVGFDPGAGGCRSHALFDLRMGGCPRRIIKSATMRLTFGRTASRLGLAPASFGFALGHSASRFGFPAAGFGLTLGRPTARLSFPAAVIRSRTAIGTAGTPAFGTPPAPVTAATA